MLPAIVGSISTALILKWLFQSPVGEAWAERIRAGAHRRRHWKGLGGEWVDTPGDAALDDKRAAELEARLTMMDGQLSELAERVDFAERLLAERRKEQLGAGH